MSEMTGPHPIYSPVADPRDRAWSDPRAAFVEMLRRAAPTLVGAYQRVVRTEDADHEREVAEAEASAAQLGFEIGYAAAAHNVPRAFITALTEGTDCCHVTVDRLVVHCRLSGTGTGIPDPAAGPAWHQLTAVIRDVTQARLYISDLIRPDLPPQIAAAHWADTHGRPVRVTRHQP